MTRTMLALALAGLIAACSTSSPDVVQRGDAQRLSTVQDATVLSVRDVVVDGSQSGTGAAAGGVVGGVLASAASSRGAESVALGVVGAVAGAVVGNTIERASTREQAVELILQMRSGERRAIVQSRGDEAFRPGDAVILVSSGGKTRVTKAPPGTVPTTAKPEPVYAPGGRP
jgi:outer membrane lipoprotein SlyB